MKAHAPALFISRSAKMMEPKNCDSICLIPEYHKCKNVVLKESVCNPRINAGEFELLRANQNVMSVFCGHDHKNDFFGKVDGIRLGYTPSCGFSSYGPGTDRGGRLITFHEDTPMTFETKLLRYCDLIARHTHNRLKEYCDAHIPTCWPNRETQNTMELFL